MEKNKNLKAILLNNRGSALVYVMVSTLALIVIIATYNYYAINMKNINEKTTMSSEEETFLNDLEDKVAKTNMVNLYQPTYIRGNMKGNDYLAEIETNSKLKAKQVVETYNFTWNAQGNTITGVTYSSLGNKQQRAFVSNTETLTEDEYLINSNQVIANNSNDYKLNGNNLELDTADSKVYKVIYRIGEGKIQEVVDYPTTNSIDLTGANPTDIITVEYLDKNGKQLKFHRFTKKEATHSTKHNLSSWDRVTMVRLPNDSSIIGKREIEDILSKENTTTVTGEDIDKAFNHYNTLRVAKQVDNPVCYYWEAYSPLSSLSGANDTNPKFSLNGKCPMEGIDGYDTITDAGLKANGPYCSDASVKAQGEQAIRAYETEVTNRWNNYQSAYTAAVNAYNTAYNNWNHITNPGGAPTFRPPSPPSAPPYPTPIPCIKGARDAKLVKYETGEKLTTQLNLNFVNNITADYTILVEHKSIVPRYPVNWKAHYIEGSDVYKITEGNDNRTGGTKTLTINRTFKKNYDYNSIDLIGTHDYARETITPREISVALENAIITKVTVMTQEFEEAEFKYNIRNPKGQIIRDKKITIKD